MAPRAYWKGHIRLSLVSFPVELYSATTSRARLAFHQIHRPTGERIRHQKVVPEIGPVDDDDIVKGLEVSKGEYLTFEPEEIEALRIESKHTIDLVQFVDQHEIDPLYFEKPYFVVPDGAVANEAYSVIRAALAAARKVALGQIVLAGRETLAALQPCGKGMLLETLRSADEVRRGAPYFAEIEATASDEDQLELAKELIRRKTAPFKPEKFVDHYEQALRELVEAKAAGRTIEAADDEPRRGKVIDLMQALKSSLRDEAPPPATRKGRSAEVHELKGSRKSKPAAKKTPPAKGSGAPRGKTSRTTRRSA